jgi:cell division protein ZapE
MDLFCRAMGARAKRVHFNRFMSDVHVRLAAMRKQRLADPLKFVARDIAAGVSVLCFDELVVVDIADAMLLGGLFQALIDHGLTLVFTSNVPPHDLYRDGLQRSRFLPTIALIEKHTTVLNLDGPTDYRLRHLEAAPLYMVGSRDLLLPPLLARLPSLAGEPFRDVTTIVIANRQIPVLWRSASGLCLDFDALCGQGRGTDDYIALADEFAVIGVVDVPVLDAALDDCARRLIALVDEFYERRVNMLIVAAAPPADLYVGTRLAFEWRRTVSRLAEMQTPCYLSTPHRLKETAPT